MKAKIGLIVLACVLAASIAGNLLLYSTWTIATADNTSLKEDITNLETQVTSLQTQVNNLGTQVDALELENSQLESDVESLQWQVDYLEDENAELKSANLGLIDTWWTDNHPLFGSSYVNAYGTVVNFGKETAYNVVITVKIYEEAVLLKTENISLEDIWGEWYGKFDVDIEYSGDADSVDMSVSYT